MIQAFVRTTVLACMATLAIASCDRSAPVAAPANSVSTLRAVCTTGMVADMVAMVGGDKVSATPLMGEGVDPHLYKPSPADVRLLADADVVFYNGLHLEGKMGELLEQLSKTKPVVAITRSIPEPDLLSPDGAAGTHDPHVWFDVSLWARTIPAVKDGLAAARPAHAAEFTQRADAYAASLAALHEKTKAAIATIPAESRILVTAHDAFGYFARAYGLEVHAIQGISTESEAALKDINALVDLLVTRKVPAVFVESSVPRKNIEALIEGCAARGHTVRIGGELFSDAMGAKGTPEGTYPGMVEHNVRTIVEALAPKGAK